MPKYELMYILASTVSDDQVPNLSDQIKKYVADFGGSDIEETQLGKKKLAYPIKKTRNGHYVVVNFEIDSKRVYELDAKIRTQSSIIRYIIVNLEEHLSRLEKDKVAQSKLTRRPELAEESEGEKPATAKMEPSEEKKQPQKTEQPTAEITTEELDKKIEEALTEDLLK